MKTSLLLIGSITSFNANALLIESDLLHHGDDLITIDTSTKLQWLDVAATLGLSYNQANASHFSDIGFRHATGAEMLTLFNAAELLNSNARIASNYWGGRLLEDLMGPGIDYGNVIEFEGWYNTGSSPSTAVIDYSKYGMNGIASLGPNFYSPDAMKEATGNFMVRFCGFPGGGATYGCFPGRGNRYHPVAIPEPGAAGLLATGLLALVLVRRRVLRAIHHD